MILNETMLSFFSHEVAEAAQLISYSFGVEDVDKHLVLFKKVHLMYQ